MTPPEQSDEQARGRALEIAGKVGGWIRHHMKMEQTQPEPLRVNVIELDAARAIADALTAARQDERERWEGATRDAVTLLQQLATFGNAKNVRVTDVPERASNALHRIRDVLPGTTSVVMSDRAPVSETEQTP